MGIRSVWASIEVLGRLVATLPVAALGLVRQVTDGMGILIVFVLLRSASALRGVFGAPRRSLAEPVWACGGRERPAWVCPTAAWFLNRLVSYLGCIGVCRGRVGRI
ncbi:MAG: hypothetical protein ACREJD_02725 [Phycisphaerales bacterium]